MTSQLPDDKKKTLFQQLVEMQDAGTSVEASRKQMAETFGLAVSDVVQIEREGIAKNWPPLDISFPSPELLADQAASHSKTDDQSA